MRRTIANVIAAVALVALVTLLAATVASFWVYPRLGLADANKTSYGATVVRGELCLNLQYSAYYPNDGERFVFVFLPIPRNEAPVPGESFWNRRGFWAATRVQSTHGRQPPPEGWRAPAWFALLGLANDQPVSSLSVGIPMWLPIVLAALPPVRLAWKCVRRRNRLAALCCAACGYDLRATPDRCPECGAVPERVPRTAA